MYLKDVGTFNGPIRLRHKSIIKARDRAHKAFDRLWQEKHMSRKAAYKWLKKLFKLTRRDAHIGLLCHEQCDQLAEAVDMKIKKLEQVRISREIEKLGQVRSAFRKIVKQCVDNGFYTRKEVQAVICTHIGIPIRDLRMRELTFSQYKELTNMFNRRIELLCRYWGFSPSGWSPANSSKFRASSSNLEKGTNFAVTI